MSAGLAQTPEYLLEMNEHTKISRKNKSERILAIETSSPRLSLAAGSLFEVLKTYQGPLQWRHAESLFSGMENLLRQVRWPVQSLTGVAVSTGPGSFTGIRIGLAAARALGQALEIPVIGVSSLPTLAQGSLKPGRYVCPLINALRGDVFTALYYQDSRGIKTLWKESRWPWARVQQKLKSLKKAELWMAGDALPLYRKELKALGGSGWHFVGSAQGYPHAGKLLQLAARRIPSANGTSYRQVLPLYLRDAAAQERQKTR